MQKSTFSVAYDCLRQQLVAARQTAALSQRDLAKKLEVQPSVIAKIETGERRIDLVEFCWLCSACKVDPHSILREIQKLAGTAIDSASEHAEEKS